MIRKLRIRFVLVAVLLASMVLAAVLGTVAVSARKQVDEESKRALFGELKRGETEGPKLFRIEMMPWENLREIQSLLPAFSVVTDQDGKILSANTQNVEIEEESIELAVKQVHESGKKEGTLNSPSLRYQCEPSGENTRIAFVALDNELANLRRTYLTLGLVGLGSLLAFFMISVLLSSVALAPVERAWEQQRRFVADASHELKTPLTVMLANTSILASHPDSTLAAQQTWLDNTRAEAQRMKKLVDDLLYLAKSDDTRAPMEKSRVCLSDDIWSCLLSFEPVAYEAGVELESDVAAGVMVMGDESRLKQLMAILLDNACKYAGASGRIRVTLEARQGKARLRINNTGEAIPQEKLAHIFERFYRADPARYQGGYGLGLAIAKDIVARHDGKISAQSDAESGTTMTVVFSTVNG